MGTPPEAVVGRAIDGARAAQPAWALTPVKQRLKLLGRFRRLLADRLPLLEASLAGLPNRRPDESLSAEILPLADACQFLERRAARLLAVRREGAWGRPAWLWGVRLEVRREPFGVVLIVGPANYPLFLPGSQAVQALAAGNAAVLKPGRGGALAARALAALLIEAGLDPRLVPVLDEVPEAAAAAMAAGVDKVLLTGSAHTGEAVLAALAPRIVPSAMELSGCDAVFVLDGADLDLAARAIAYGLTLNGGASCISPRRAFVAPPALRPFEDALARALVQVAPVALPLSASEALAEIVAAAPASGVRVLSGSQTPTGWTPVVLSGVKAEMRLARLDIAAPLLSIMPVEDLDQAVADSLACPYALGASVFGPDHEARALAVRLNAGVVVVNDVVVPTADPRVSFGGRGRSGFGVTRGPEGLLELTRLKVVAVRRGRFRPHLRPAVEPEVLRSLIGALHGRGPRRRLSGLLGLAGAHGREAPSDGRASQGGPAGQVPAPEAGGRT